MDVRSSGGSVDSLSCEVLPDVGLPLPCWGFLFVGTCTSTTMAAPCVIIYRKKTRQQREGHLVSVTWLNLQRDGRGTALVRDGMDKHFNKRKRQQEIRREPGDGHGGGYESTSRMGAKGQPGEASWRGRRGAWVGPYCQTALTQVALQSKLKETSQKLRRSFTKISKKI